MAPVCMCVFVCGIPSKHIVDCILRQRIRICQTILSDCLQYRHGLILNFFQPCIITVHATFGCIPSHSQHKNLPVVKCIYLQTTGRQPLGLTIYMDAKNTLLVCMSYGLFALATQRPLDTISNRQIQTVLRL